MEDEKKKKSKGTVTSLASMFPVEEATKASKRVEEAISEKQNELKNIKDFIADNTNLINLISRLPDELHHDIMVPFGKAAFFPGKLIHTNELMVLLGEGYYAERTAKQTVDILKRRGKVLDSQVESLEANIKDLRAEASFFYSTASEAAEGLVEIREDYVEEGSSEGISKSEAEVKKVGVEDDEYARMMSRLDELEKEELEAEGNNESDEDEVANSAESDNESDENGHTDTVESDNESDKANQTYTAERDAGSHESNNILKANFNRFPSQTHSELREPQKQPQIKNASIEALSNKYRDHLDIADQPNCTGLTVQPTPRVDISNSKILTHSNKSIPAAEKAFQHPTVKKELETLSSSKNEAFTSSIVEHSGNLQINSQGQNVTSAQAPVWTSNPGFDSSKAFTGSIVERVHHIPTSHEQTTTSSKLSDPQPSKPVSRFKMQRR